MGKPIQYSLSVDVPLAARCINWFGEAIDKVYDEIAPTARNALALIQREPMGVIGVIAPAECPLLALVSLAACLPESVETVTLTPTSPEIEAVLREADRVFSTYRADSVVSRLQRAEPDDQDVDLGAVTGRISLLESK